MTNLQQCAVLFEAITLMERTVVAQIENETTFVLSKLVVNYQTAVIMIGPLDRNVNHHIISGSKSCLVKLN